MIPCQKALHDDPSVHHWPLPYHVEVKFGEGGMGAALRATDTKLHREVAIKVLPSAFAEDSASTASSAMRKC